MTTRDCGSCCTDPTPNTVEPATLTIEEVEELLRRGNAKTFLFDANPRDLYLQRHLPGARWIRYDAVTADLLPADRQATLVFYCTGPKCSASPRAARAALELGWANVYVMPAGIIGWVRAGRAVEGA